jgi:hypothetical protein
LNGEADEAGKSVSERKLAVRVGVSRPTVKTWRAMKQYQNRRDMVALARRRESERNSG